MEIPIQNIYFLLCYAWDKLDERELVEVDPVGITSLVDLFARVLINGTNHLLKRGFDRNYVAHEERTARLKGKIRFDSVVKSGVVTTTLPCEFDELSFDVLHNQLLKATIRRLMRTEAISQENSEHLAGLFRQLSDVRDIEITARLFGQVQLHRNNRFYDFLMKVCELIHRNLLISETAGRSKFRDFSRDRQQMAMLYEEFVRNFYRIHSHYRVRRQDIYWRWAAQDQAAAGLLPKMQTDISLESDQRKIIIDCKYTPEVTKQHYESNKLRSEHLYQINAYLDNLPEEDAGCEAMLLYPTAEKAISASYTHKAHTIRIETVNLNQPWTKIHDDLLRLVAEPMKSDDNVRTCSAKELSPQQLSECLAIISEGEAVNIDSATAELPLAYSVALKQIGAEIVGVGVIKRKRPEYASGRARKSGYTFDVNTSELGYVAVKASQQGKGLSKEIVAALIESAGHMPLFATTSNGRMKKTLKDAGFVQRGNEWQGNNSILSLWIREGR